MLANKISNYAAPGERVKAVYTTMTQGMTKPQIIAARAQIVAAMLAQINTEGPGNVSKHCADHKVLNVVDLGINRFTTTSSRLRFVEAACSDSRVSRFLSPVAYKCTQTYDPTYHLEFPQTAGASSLASDVTSTISDGTDVAKEDRKTSAFKNLSSLVQVVSGIVSTGHVEFSFTAKENDTLEVIVRATQIFPGLQATNDDSMVFLFDASNTLLASNDDDETSGLSASLNAVAIPASGSYKLVITTFPNTPILSGTGILEGWNDNGESSIAFEVEIVLVSALPQLELHRLENGQLLFEWEGNEILQEAESPLGAWTDNASLSSPHMTNISAVNKFYRLRRP